jgi:hypothetical protein
VWPTPTQKLALQSNTFRVDVWFLIFKMSNQIEIFFFLQTFVVLVHNFFLKFITLNHTYKTYTPQTHLKQKTTKKNLLGPRQNQPTAISTRAIIFGITCVQCGAGVETRWLQYRKPTAQQHLSIKPLPICTSNHPRVFLSLNNSSKVLPKVLLTKK